MGTRNFGHNGADEWVEFQAEVDYGDFTDEHGNVDHDSAHMLKDEIFGIFKHDSVRILEDSGFHFEGWHGHSDMPVATLELTKKVKLGEFLFDAGGEDHIFDGDTFELTLLVEVMVENGYYEGFSLNFMKPEYGSGHVYNTWDSISEVIDDVEHEIRQESYPVDIDEVDSSVKRRIMNDATSVFVPEYQQLEREAKKIVLGAVKKLERLSVTY